MKRIGAIVCLCIMLFAMSASACFAKQDGLTIEKQYPEDGATGTSVENVSIKVWFNQDVRPKDQNARKANKKHIKLVDEKGKSLPIYVAYSPDEEGLMMVLTSDDTTVKSDSKYTLTIDPGFKATSGQTLASQDKVSFTTLNQSRAMTINMLMMVVMVVGMIFFSSRSMKRQMEKEKAEKGKHDTVNPYKEAKRTGKSVEEIVEKDKKIKEKEAAAAAKRAAKYQKEREEEEKERKAADPNRKRVTGPRPISAGGGKYKAPKKQSQAAASNKGTTRPKNQTGKQKNSKNKSKKK
ncbi:MAG: Ig-like domain-containing protein [Firmicutes bacterium]|nr:Ig-like domain-containing protein [Bacillota bacterium]